MMTLRPGYINNVMQRRLVQRVSEEITNYDRPPDPVIMNNEMKSAPRITRLGFPGETGVLTETLSAPVAAPIQQRINSAGDHRWNIEPG